LKEQFILDQILAELKKQAALETAETFHHDKKKIKSFIGKTTQETLLYRLIEDRKKNDPEFARMMLKRRSLNKKIFIGIGSFIFLIVLISILGSSDSEDSVKQAAILYPDSIVTSISEANTSKASGIERYETFEMATLLGLQPTEEDMLLHKKVLLDAYAAGDYNNIRSLSPERLLKLVYSARIVDKYFVLTKNGNDPLAQVSFDVFQISRDAYRGNLEDPFYESNLSQINKKVLLIQ
jgi:hypothetical protein